MKLKVIQDRKKRQIIIDADTLEYIAVCPIINQRRATDTMKLLAAAPEMLRVLEETLKKLNEIGLAALNAMPNSGNMSTYAYMIEQAIKQAEGQL